MRFQRHLTRMRGTNLIVQTENQIPRYCSLRGHWH